MNTNDSNTNKIDKYQFDKATTKDNEDKKTRAWIELDFQALKDNISFLKDYLPPSCEIMAVLKANAYGHGAVLIGRALNSINVKTFAVATVQEGIELRKQGIIGEILLLGYTSISEINLVKKYQLTQTIVDTDYAQLLNSANKKIDTHLAIDTGMHRLGVDSNDLQAIEAIFKMRNINVKGIFTHLSAPDGHDEVSVDYTKIQIQSFYDCINYLKSRGIEIPKCHLQSTYGALNYKELNTDIARIGNAMYGILSKEDKSLLEKVRLKPVLSLKTRIATIRHINKGDKVGYNMQYIACRDMKIATITIGYADGLASSLANGGEVLVNNKKIPIIGRMCMDQTMIDLTDVDDIEPNNIVTVIGKSETQEITVYDVARITSKSTNELLSQLSRRINRIMI